MRILVNPAAAGGRLGREWPRLEPRLREGGVDAPVVFTEAPGHATELAEEAVAGGIETVVVAGGDGTLCEAAEGLHRAGRGRLGILPRGTGNDAARTLGIPLDFRDAVRVLSAGRTRRVDLVAVDGHVVLNAIGVGLTGDINLRASRIKRIRGMGAYLVAALASLFRYHAPEVTITTPDLHRESTMLILAVHGGPTTGGGFRLTPAADPADGLLDACFVEGMNPLRRLHRLVAAMRGTMGRLRGSLELQAPWLELRHAQPLAGHLDGNQWTFEPPLTRFEVLPGALEVVVPPPSA